MLTRPDKPKGRGLPVEASEVKREAARRGIPVLQPPTLKGAEASASLLAQTLDVLVVAAYGLILPRHVLVWPPTALNKPASRLRAGAGRRRPAGDRSRHRGDGVTIMQMD